MSEARTIAFAGAGGSHPATISAIAMAMQRLRPDLRRVMFDMTDFDRRGDTRATVAGVEQLRIGPAAMGLPQLFRTAAPNLVISGGARRYRAMVDRFASLLHREQVGVLMMSHVLGFPEQALVEAARELRISTAQIDEGPFSYPIRPRGAPEFSPNLKGRMMALLKRAGVLPGRDLTGDRIDLFFATSPGRGRILLERGLPEARLMVVPCPRFDSLAQLAQRWPSRARGETKRVLLIHQPFARDRKVAAGEARRAELALIGALAEVQAGSGCAVRIRMHPRSSQSEVDRMAWLSQRARLQADWATAPSFADELMTSDLVVGFYSSALIEAAACGAPVAAAWLDPEAFSEAFEGRKAAAFPDLGIATGMDAAEIADILREQLAKDYVPPSPALCDLHLGKLDGSGAAQVAARLIDMLA